MESNDPKYLVIRTELEKMLDQMKVDQRLPSERTLRDHFGCNALTVRKAMNILVEEGKIVKKIGSGSYKAHKGESTIERIQSKGEPQQIGLILHPQSDAYANELLRAIYRQAHHQKLNIQIASPENFQEGLTQVLSNFSFKKVGSAIIPWFPPSDSQGVAEYIRQAPHAVSIPIPILGFEKNCHEKPESYGQNSFKAVESIFSYYKLLGYKDFAFVGPNNIEDTIVQKNVSAYTKIVCENHLENRCELVDNRSNTMDHLAQKWQAQNKFLAIFCYDDNHATRLMTAFHKLGWQAPINYSLCCFNNTPSTEIADPPITTLSHSHDDFALSLINNALSLINNVTTYASSTPTLTLTVRQSCGGSIKKNLQELCQSIQPKVITQMAFKSNASAS